MKFSCWSTVEGTENDGLVDMLPAGGIASGVFPHLIFTNWAKMSALAQFVSLFGLCYIWARPLKPNKLSWAASLNI